MNYIQVHELLEVVESGNRLEDRTSQLAETDILLVAKEMNIGSFKIKYDYTVENLTVYPAVYRGDKAFFWESKESSTQNDLYFKTVEGVWSFEEGAKFLIKQGAFQHLFSKDVAE